MARRRTHRLSCLLMLALLFAACSSSEPPPEPDSQSAIEKRLAELSGAGVFVGGVAATGTFVAFEGAVEPFETDGKITLPDATKHNFFTRPAGDGAGIFEITVGADGAWNGKALDGSTFKAAADGPYVTGEVVSTGGERYPFRHNDLTQRLDYGIAGGQPDTYMAIVTRQATEIQGRGGDVRGGKPDGNVISLDMDQSESVTPGVYHGRVAGTTDRLNFEFATDPSGARLLRSYVSDSEPEPDGDIQWFVGPVPGAQFDMPSKSGDARIAGVIADDGISGQITLPDGTPRKYFAAPSGQGSGIYTVTVAADRRHTGTSEQGGKFVDLNWRSDHTQGSRMGIEIGRRVVDRGHEMTGPGDD